MSATTAGEPRRRAEVLPERRPATAPKRRGAASAPGRRILTVVPAQRTAPVAPGRRTAASTSRRAAPASQVAEPQVSARRQETGQPGQEPPMALPAARPGAADGYTGRGQARRRAPGIAVAPPFPGPAGEQAGAPTADSRPGERLRALPVTPAAPAGGRSPGAREAWRAERSRQAVGQRVRRVPNPAAVRSARSRPRVRLTRRGRIVVSTLVMAAVLGVAALAWLAGTARAEASGSGVPASAIYKSMRSVIVLPGQSLWTIAAQAEPSGDPRSVIQQIIDLNALGGTSIHPGQRLLIPRG